MKEAKNIEEKKPKKENEAWRTIRFILFGVLTGIVLTCGVSFIFRTWWLKDYIEAPIINNKCDTSKEALVQSVEQLKVLNASFVEKMDAVNKRLDDFLVFGGLIITLLLAISISVYLKTESEVDKHMKKDFAKNKEDIEKVCAAANNKLGEIEGILIIAQQKQIELENLTKSPQTIPQ